LKFVSLPLLYTIALNLLNGCSFIKFKFSLYRAITIIHLSSGYKVFEPELERELEPELERELEPELERELEPEPEP
jgi:hypothetical protein